MWAHRAVLISVSIAVSWTQAILEDHGYGANASHGVPVYASAFQVPSYAAW